MREKIESLFAKLATEQEMENGTAAIVYYKGKPGNLSMYDAGLGFTWISTEDDELHP